VSARADACFVALVVLAGVAASALAAALVALGAGGVTGLGAIVAGWFSACALLIAEARHVPLAALVTVLVVSVTAAMFGVGCVRVVAEQRTLARLGRSATRRVLFGEPVLVVPSRYLAAFCAGLRGPRVYVSDGLVRALPRDELEAVVRHEAAHAAALGPLKSTIARTLAGSFFWLPALRDLEATYALTAECAADRAAVESTSRRAVASALERVLESPSAPGFANLADARVATLLGARGAPRLVSRWRFAATMLALTLLGWLVAAQPRLSAAEHEHLDALAGSVLLHRFLWERLLVVMVVAASVAVRLHRRRRAGTTIV
jgi:Zn-dependent protease with chaperone function